LDGEGAGIDLTGRRIDAPEALRLGLVEQVVPRRSTEGSGQDLAQTIVSRAPLAVKYAKRPIVQAWELPLTEGLKVEAELYTLLRTTEDRMEGPGPFRKAPTAVQGTLAHSLPVHWRRHGPDEQTRTRASRLGGKPVDRPPISFWRHFFDKETSAAGWRRRCWIFNAPTIGIS
jgi:hypothetical protein